ncbi:ATP-binding protein [bacterium]|nr:ATP-binding protein [candidate division CSSED10-310 bacterium]
MPRPPWKCWHEVVALRDDLKSGELPLHMFAADLYEVMMQGGKRPIYEDPNSFFALTFPTYNLRKLVRDVVRRVAGQNDKAVRQLELTYGGGKTHTLITLRHLVTDPDNLPDLPAVREFREAIGRPPPRARVAGLCFDKLDVETGMAVRDPQGGVKRLVQPWSIMAYQLAGDEGLRILNAGKSTAERESAPAENTLTELLEAPAREGLGVLILIDEVLMYVREKVSSDRKWRDRMINFFQYLTQAATKVDRCCVVASLLASDPAKSDSFGRQLQGELYDIFQRQREEAVEPVVKEDVAEVLRRRFFTPESIKDKDAFRSHVQAALKGVFNLNEQSRKQGSDVEDRYLRSYPFHPDLTEVFYAKWTQLDHFQRTRGILRTFALALREAEHWDTSPLVGPCVFLTDPSREGLSEAMRELVTVADTENTEGKKQLWTAVIEGETAKAREIQHESVGLQYREIEQAVIAVFLHSQPVGQLTRTRDVVTLIAPNRPDQIELEKGMIRWAHTSFWLDDRYTPGEENRLPTTWRLGNRPNLTQMHAVAASRISDEAVRARLLDEISKCKELKTGASGGGVRVHMLPTRPGDIDDDGVFHYGILGPDAAGDSGKPSTLARRYLDETTSADKPRVYRNSVILLTPARDGLEIASGKVRDYLAWEDVKSELKPRDDEGTVDVARMQTLKINLDKSRGRIPEAVKQAYCIVVTVSEKNEIQAFKINVTDDQHFVIIKKDKRARIQESSITAEALLPDGPYDLWREGETSRRVKDLAGAFAQFPHLPKMLKSQAITDTLVDGCAAGAFVLRLRRPDDSARTWWRERPDDASIADPAMELVLPQAAELMELPPGVLEPERLPGLWESDSITVQTVVDYFSGKNVVQVQRDGYSEPVAIPKAGEAVVHAAIAGGIEGGALWLTNGPASILGEAVPAGVLNNQATLRMPPAPIAPAMILPENLPDAWRDGRATALSVATALSQQAGVILPWKTVKDVIGSAVNARFIELDPLSGEWPCEYPSAQSIRLQVTLHERAPGPDPYSPETSPINAAEADLEAGEVQDLADAIPELLAIKSRSGISLAFRVRIAVGDEDQVPDEETVTEINEVLKEVKPGFEVRRR